MHIFSVCLVGYGTFSIMVRDPYPRRLIIFLVQFIFIYFKTVLWIQILWVGSGYGSGSSISSESGSGPGYLWLKVGKKYSGKFFLSFFWWKIAIYLSLGLLKSRPSQRRSLQPTKENIQHFKKLNLSIFVGHFCPPGSGSGSNPDTDPVSTKPAFQA